jgi:hypothetical protein
MDGFQARQIKNLRERHEIRIQENALRIQEHIGYVLKRIENGRPESVGLYAEDLAASVERIRSAVASLEALKEGLAILATSDGEA